MSTYYGPRTEVVRYGPDIPTESELRFLGDLDGRRVLELGSGSRSSAVAMAKQGAHVIVVDPHPDRVAEARVLAEDQEVKAEWHEGEMSDLAFLRADSVDLAFSAGAILEIADFGRLVRQVHRVLKPGAGFVFAYDHPAGLIARGRTYWDDTPIPATVDGIPVEQHPQPLSTVYMALARGGFRVEALAEPEPVTGPRDLPPTIVWRARKEGV